MPIHCQNHGIIFEHGGEREAKKDDGIDSENEFVVAVMVVDDGQQPGPSSRLPQQRRRTIAELPCIEIRPLAIWPTRK
jgi:hypothetical protein